jgi:uncharacterized protein YbaP (TraB family)
MFLHLRSCLVLFVSVAAFGLAGFRVEAASGCIWKVTGPNGGTLYLGGSIHVLRSTDYPLPAGYNHAFEASSRVALEVDPKALEGSSASLLKAGKYPKGDSLKNHVDPRTYDYLRRLFALMKIPEQKFSAYRPWCLVLLLESPSGGFSHELGVDEFISNRARANGKTIVGLETADEHSSVYSGLSERQSEALLLVSLIPSEGAPGGREAILNAWRKGDAETLSRNIRVAYSDFPAFADRLLGARNRRWIPKMESYLKSGQTYFVVVGAGHLGGSEGLLALLRARNYKLEQL